MAKTVTATMRAVAVTPMRAGSARQVELPIPAALVSAIVSFLGSKE